MANFDTSQNMNLSSIVNDTRNNSSFVSQGRPGIFLLPFQPNIRDKLMSCHESSQLEDIEHDQETNKKLFVDNYKNFLQKEISKCKGSTYITVNDESRQEVGVNINFQGKTNESVLILEEQHKVIKKIQEEVFGDYTYEGAEDELAKCITHEIEECSSNEQKNVYLRAVNSKKIVDVLSYIFSEPREDDKFKDLLKRNNIFTGVADGIYTHARVLYKRGIKEQARARKLTKESSTITKGLIESITQNFDHNQFRYERNMKTRRKRADLEKRQKTRETFTESDVEETLTDEETITDRVQGETHTQIRKYDPFKEKSRKEKKSKSRIKKVEINIEKIKQDFLTAEELQYRYITRSIQDDFKHERAMVIKNSIIKDDIKRTKNEIKQKQINFNRRVELRIIKAKNRNVIMSFFGIVLFYRTMEQYGNICETYRSIIRKKNHYKNSIRKIQQFYRKRKNKDYKPIDTKKTMREILTKRAFANFFNNSSLKSFYNRIVITMWMKISQVKKIQRFFREKLELNFFEKSILAMKVNKMFIKNFRKSSKFEIDRNNHINNANESDESEPSNTETSKKDYGLKTIKQISHYLEKVLNFYNIDNTMGTEETVETMFNLHNTKIKQLSKFQSRLISQLKEQFPNLNFLEKGTAFWKDVWNIIIKEEMPFSGGAYNLDDKYDLKLDPIHIESKQFTDMLHENEAIAKAKVIETFYSQKIHKYLKSVKDWLDKLVSFSEINKERIDIMRTREMMNIGSKKLNNLFKIENENAIMHQNKKRPCHGAIDLCSNYSDNRDFLPFGNKLLRFAEKLDDHPVKPVYHLDYGQKEFDSQVDTYFKIIKHDVVKMRNIIRKQERKIEN